MPQYTHDEIKEIKKCFNLYVKFPKNRWKEIERAEKNDVEGNKIYNYLKEEFLEKYMPAPNDDPHGITKYKISNGGISKSPYQDEMI
jgi:hypothetical protein